MFLDDPTFQTVVGATPLVSIDLILRNEDGEVLLGLRRNRPAAGSWFVPGGRIRKNERLDEALSRVLRSELGYGALADPLSWAGVYEHFYPDSVFGEAPDHPSTHYVVLAYEGRLPKGALPKPEAQHETYAWWPPERALESQKVHEYTKAYLVGSR